MGGREVTTHLLCSERNSSLRKLATVWQFRQYTLTTRRGYMLQRLWRGNRMFGMLASVLLILALFPSAVLAHDTGQVPTSFWESCSFEPVTILSIGIAALWYAAGLRHLRRQPAGSTIVPNWRVAFYYIGLLILLLALVSPLHVYGELLISVHMAQHMIMTMVAAPFLVLGDPLLVMLWAFPSNRRRTVALQLSPRLLPHRLATWLFQPVVALLLHLATILIWHLPPLYQAAVHAEWVHYLQPATFCGTALLFWWPVIETTPARRTMSYPMKLLYLFFAMLFQTKLIGGMLTFVSDTIYVHYAETAHLWNVTALDDQRLAGIFMLVGGFMMYMMAFTAVFFVWAHHASQHEPDNPPLPQTYQPATGQRQDV